MIALNVKTHHSPRGFDAQTPTLADPLAGARQSWHSRAASRAEQGNADLERVRQAGKRMSRGKGEPCWSAE
eukprot:8766048-Pyramimonas_sp.AAC.1